VTTGWLWSERYLWHDSRGPADVAPLEALFEPEPSPESATSKRRLMSLVETSGLGDHLVRLSPVPARREDLLRIHDEDYVDRVRELSDALGGDAGEEGLLGRGSFEVALLAAGGALVVVDAVLDGEVDNAYALVRPPGHHAERARGRGYCLFGNVAVAVAHALADRGLERVAVVDWDVHHGNGTEQAFWTDPRVLTVSVHQDRRYPPDSGSVDDVGAGAGTGFALNVPLPAGGGRAVYEHAFDEVVLPALDLFRPELIVVSSGFDANCRDPSARMALTPSCFGRLTTRLMDSAARLCDGRLAMVHEGGYSTGLVPYCGLAVLQAMSGHVTDVPIERLSDPVPISMPLHEHERAHVARAAENLLLLRSGLSLS
jgi:acetoin utilization deacetylase AcuC-like enzyme